MAVKSPTPRRRDQLTSRGPIAKVVHGIYDRSGIDQLFKTDAVVHASNQSLELTRPADGADGKRLQVLFPTIKLI